MQHRGRHGSSRGEPDEKRRKPRAKEDRVEQAVTHGQVCLDRGRRADKADPYLQQDAYLHSFFFLLSTTSIWHHELQTGIRFPTECLHRFNRQVATSQ